MNMNITWSVQYLMYKIYIIIKKYINLVKHIQF